MELVRKVARLLSKSPVYVVKRLWSEFKICIDRFIYSRPDKKISGKNFLQIANARSINELWERHQSSDFIFDIKSEEDIWFYKTQFPNLALDVFAKADMALQRKVSLLGTGTIDLGKNIQWNKDYKSGVEWGNRYYRDISYVNFDDKSDVKIPWEISRLQWMIPVGQAYEISRDEKYAEFAKEILADWIDKNPYGHSVNWTCTMEVALRIIVLEYFFFVFAGSKSWHDETFRFIFLKSIYFHNFFTIRNLEKSDINGNHYTADGAGLVFGGIFLQGYDKASVFYNAGIEILESEIIKQVLADGVDYEASIPYHRLVTELFFYPLLYAQRTKRNISKAYEDRVKSMAYFTSAYSRINGTVPLIGDADDARVLPMGSQHLNNHLYLGAIIGLWLKSDNLITKDKTTIDEVFWLFGKRGVDKVLNSPLKTPFSEAFKNGGFFILAENDVHILIDCGPLGLAGRGGHGHNDILSIEIMYAGRNLISDCGSFLYTADYIERNNFRGTAYHNSPMVNGEEINRFITPKYLWTLKNDAKPVLRKWISNKNMDVFVGAHTGYLRLEQEVLPIRTVVFDKITNNILLADTFEIKKNSGITIVNPLHFWYDVQIVDLQANLMKLNNGGRIVNIYWDGPGWEVMVKDARISPSYGVVYESKKIVWQYTGEGVHPLKILLTEKKYDNASSVMDELLQSAIEY